MDVGEFKEYIRRYEPDELFYKEMYEKRQAGEREFCKFIEGADRQDIITRRLYVPELSGWYEDGLDEIYSGGLPKKRKKSFG